MLDALPQEASAPTPQPRELDFRFTGKTGEYFRIWIVNLALTILTLGIYSAWAKVRTTRYFYGHSWLDGHNFEYHARPVQILMGRVIAVAVFAAYSILSEVSIVAAGVLFLLVLCASPWLIVASLRFRARMSSYRNLRFDFAGTPGQAAVAYLLYPALAFLTFLLAYPASARKGYHFIGNGHRYGGRPFAARLSLGFFYGTYALALLIVLLLTVVAAFIAAAVGGSQAIGTIFTLRLLPVALAAFILITRVFVRTRCTRHLFNNLVLDERHRFRCRMNALRMIWIRLTNVAAVICSLGFLYPWARIRESRYFIESLTAVSDGDLSAFFGTAEGDASATSRELAEIFDLDVGL